MIGERDTDGVMLVSEQVDLQDYGADLVRVEALPAGGHLRYSIHAPSLSGGSAEKPASACVEAFDSSSVAWRSLHALLPGCMRTNATPYWEWLGAAVDGDRRRERLAEFQADYEELKRVALSILGMG